MRAHIRRLIDGDPERKGFGANAAWILFLLTCVQLVFLLPYVVIVPGQRANLFSGLLCAFSLLLAVLFGGGRLRGWRSPEALISFILLALISLSGALSAAPATSLIRGFVMASAGLGGFWCSRILLRSEPSRRLFMGFCVALYAAVGILAILGVVTAGTVYRFLDSHWHPVGARVLLLSFAPLALIGSGSRWGARLGVALVCLGYVVLLLCGKYQGMESVLIIPPVLCVLAVCLRTLSIRQWAIMVCLTFVTSFLLFGHLSQHRENLDKYHESVAYRVENIFFSWEIAKAHPLLGIGLWAPRDAYLEGHQIRYPFLSKEGFADSTRRLRTSENMVLTFLADLGFPFVILYASALAALSWRLVRMSVGGGSASPFHPLVLLLPIAAEILHLQICDDLFHPQISWFFHVLLGMVPVSSRVGPISVERWRPVLMKFGAIVACVILGALLGFTIPRGIVFR